MSTALRLISTGALALFITPTLVQGAGSAEGDRLSVAEAALRSLVEKRCQRFTCLLAVDGEPLPSRLVTTLARLGKAESIVAGDLVIENGTARGLARRDASRIFNLTGIEIKADRAGLVIDDIAGGSGRCFYSLRKASRGWALIASETRCTLS